MGTRKFCDQCGNTVHEFEVLSYGPLRDRMAQERDRVERSMMAIHNSRSGYGGNGVGAATLPAKPTAPIVDVELCQHCVPIWLDRVAKLTKQSDV